MKLVCINCPRGCNLEVSKEKQEIKVSGNFCPRGITYAKNELTNPQRMVTTTIGINSQKERRLPVITNKTVNKEKVIEVIKALKDVEVKAPIKMGEIIVKNVANTGSDIIASKSVLE